MPLPLAKDGYTVIVTPINPLQWGGYGDLQKGKGYAANRGLKSELFASPAMTPSGKTLLGKVATEGSWQPYSKLNYTDIPCPSLPGNLKSQRSQ